MEELTHASFFSGVGGTDIGLERAGWHTVSFSEVDPYACVILAERWPGVPNLGDIVDVAGADPLRRDEGEQHRADAERRRRGTGEAARPRHWHRAAGRPDVQPLGDGSAPDWARATLWTGGFPCQDLSVAGKRRGFDGERSVLAFAFLRLVERHRPPAILLENVPGLLSSHGGRDMAALCGRMVELGYGVAYRILDAQHFGVPQRRRRVFILGLRSDPDDVDGRVAAERAAAVLSVGARCGRHLATGHQAGAGVADGFDGGPIGTLREHVRPGSNTDHSILSPPPDPGGVRAPDGLAGRLDGGDELAYSVRPRSGMPQGWNSNLVGALRVGANHPNGGPQHGDQVPIIEGGGMTVDDPLLPLGLDSHRYRCCGNGVVAPVAEWLGRCIAEALS